MRTLRWTSSQKKSDWKEKWGCRGSDRNGGGQFCFFDENSIIVCTGLESLLVFAAITVRMSKRAAEKEDSNGKCL